MFYALPYDGSYSSLKAYYARKTSRKRDGGITWSLAKDRRTASESISPSGQREFRINGIAVPADHTDVYVRVTDLSMSGQSQRNAAGHIMYALPSYVRNGSAYVRGTQTDDTLDVSQDAYGDTMLEVREGGNRGEVNLGRIASLDIASGAGDDLIRVAGSNYFGGVRVDGGGGHDRVTVEADYSMKQGVSVSGGEGADHVQLSGRALAAMIQGGGGNDRLNITAVLPEVGYKPVVYGNAGADRITGSSAGDMLYGGAGMDYLRAGAGNDIASGGDGDDLVYGGSGEDWLHGHAGIDGLIGGAGADHLRGGTGADFLYAGTGRDVMHGGSGSDNLGPITWNPRQIYAYQRIGNHLKVDTRGEYRSQPVINNLKEYYRYGKVFQDYDEDEDYLVDRNEVA